MHIFFISLLLDGHFAFARTLRVSYSIFFCTSTLFLSCHNDMLCYAAEYQVESGEQPGERVYWPRISTARSSICGV